MTFLFSFLFAGVSGYYLGDYMNLSQKGKYLLAGLVTFITITVETLLFIIKISRESNKTQQSGKTNPTATKGPPPGSKKVKN